MVREPLTVDVGGGQLRAVDRRLWKKTTNVSMSAADGIPDASAAQMSQPYEPHHPHPVGDRP
jgi:hypothetical protein